MEEMQLKKNEDGSVVQVVTTTQTQEVPLSSEEIKRQIDEHQAIVDKLTQQLQPVKDFEVSDDEETTLTIRGE